MMIEGLSQKPEESQNLFNSVQFSSAQFSSIQFHSSQFNSISKHARTRFFSILRSEVQNGLRNLARKLDLKHSGQNQRLAEIRISRYGVEPGSSIQPSQPARTPIAESCLRKNRRRSFKSRRQSFNKPPGVLNKTITSSPYKIRPGSIKSLSVFITNLSTLVDSCSVL